MSNENEIIWWPLSTQKLKYNHDAGAEIYKIKLK